jgi:hypothetical protein
MVCSTNYRWRQIITPTGKSSPLAIAWFCHLRPDTRMIAQHFRNSYDRQSKILGNVLQSRNHRSIA